MGRNVGKELKDLNIMVNYAPVADVSAPDNESDSQRSFSNDPHQVSALATAYMKGMQDAGIFSGDLVIIDRSLQASDGDYVAAYIDGEFTVKEFRSDPSGQCAWLIPHNEKYHKIRVDEDNSFVIWGVITHTIHKL